MDSNQLASTSTATPKGRKSQAELYEITPDGQLVLSMHEGQLAAWSSDRRFVSILAGTQSGKTSFGPWWLAREIEARGAGDYLAITSTYDLFKLKMLPALKEVFENVLKVGRYWSGDRIMELCDPATGNFLAQKSDDPMWGRIILRSAEADGGLECSTAKAAWLDEAGQSNFTLDAWQAILRRLSIALGRVLISTTLYNFGWLKTEVYDRWTSGDRSYQVVHFDSTTNPQFPREEFERAKATMPLWRFRMQYQGQYERPAGLIYDSFDERLCLRPRFTISPSWTRLLGLDFGGVNTAGCFYAQEPGTENLWLYRTYKAGGRTARKHADALKAGEPMLPLCVGGSKSEGQWRDEFRAGGIPVLEPDITEVEVGITRVYGAHKENRILVFDDLDDYLQEKRAYSRVLDSSGQPTEKIEAKDTYHFMDAERYIVGWTGRAPMPYLRPGTPIDIEVPTLFGRPYHTRPRARGGGALEGYLGRIREPSQLFGSHIRRW
jgi:hypothetical protein